MRVYLLVTNPWAQYWQLRDLRGQKWPDPNKPGEHKFLPNVAGEARLHRYTGTEIIVQLNGHSCSSSKLCVWRFQFLNTKTSLWSESSMQRAVIVKYVGIIFSIFLCVSASLTFCAWSFYSTFTIIPQGLTTQTAPTIREEREREREYEVRWNRTISSAHQFVFFPYLQYSPEPIKLYTQTHPHTQEIIYLSNFTLCISPEAQPLRYLDASTAASITEPTRPQSIGRYAILRPECATTDNIWMCVTPTRGGSRETKVNSLTLSGLVWPQQMSGLSHRYWCCRDVSILFLSL